MYWIWQDTRRNIHILTFTSLSIECLLRSWSRSRSNIDISVLVMSNLPHPLWLLNCDLPTCRWQSKNEGIVVVFFEYWPPILREYDAIIYIKHYTTERLHITSHHHKIAATVHSGNEGTCIYPVWSRAGIRLMERSQPKTQ